MTASDLTQLLYKQLKIAVIFDIQKTNCWICISHTTKNRVGGYTKVRINKELYYLHRVVYRAVNPELSGVDNVMHTCDNPSCCNPEHLKAGTQLDNVTDMILKGRRNTLGVKYS
jgi:hypothetical protein